MATAIDNLPIEIAKGELVTRYIELGDMAIRHARVPAGTDMTPVLQGLPNDRCPSPHWASCSKGPSTCAMPTDRKKRLRLDRSITGPPDTPPTRMKASSSSRSDRSGLCANSATTPRGCLAEANHLGPGLTRWSPHASRLRLR
jgi:hypothetical protein